MTTTLTDKSLMPFGMYKGKAMVNVPADYLLYLYSHKKCYGSVKQYIESNLDVLKGETKFSKR